MSGAHPVLGMAEWPRSGEHQRVERIITDLKALGVGQLRLPLSWSEWRTPIGPDWYDWLLPLLAANFELLPCFTCNDERACTDFADLISRFREHFEWVELHSGFNNGADWDWRPESDWINRADCVGAAANEARRKGKKIVLGGVHPANLSWLNFMAERGALASIDAIGLRATAGSENIDWDESVAKLRALLEGHGFSAQLWITEAGYATKDHDEFRQLQAFIKLLAAPVERAYWNKLYDLSPAPDHDEHYHHAGLIRADQTPKLLYRIWQAEGLAGMCALADSAKPVDAEPLSRPPASKHSKTVESTVLITGGAGFIGTNLADRLLRQGERVLILDSLARPGVEHNLRWLRAQHGERLQVMIADIRDSRRVRAAVQRAAGVFHLAAQVAVTTSLTDPNTDFEINARGTLNVLEAVRAAHSPPPLVFTSTNKVYGALADVALSEQSRRYAPEDARLQRHGIDEQRPLDFHSPYGCSKGAADQYVLDYARSFGLPAVVLRMSCIYGPHQYGTEDQGWVAHFLIRALAGQTINLYGDGKQVRDILYVDDLVNALLLARTHMDKLQAQAFNIGGGAANTVSLLELIQIIGELQAAKLNVEFAPWRTGDQRYYVSDIRKFQAATGWSAQTGVRTGVAALYRWLRAQRSATASASEVAA